MTARRVAGQRGTVHVRQVHAAADQEGGDQESAYGDGGVHGEGRLNPVDELGPAGGPVACAEKTVVVRPRPIEPPAIWNM